MKEFAIAGAVLERKGKTMWRVAVKLDSPLLQPFLNETILPVEYRSLRIGTYDMESTFEEESPVKALALAAKFFEAAAITFAKMDEEIADAG